MHQPNLANLFTPEGEAEFSYSGLANRQYGGWVYLCVGYYYFKVPNGLAHYRIKHQKKVRAEDLPTELQPFIDEHDPHFDLFRSVSTFKNPRKRNFANLYLMTCNYIDLDTHKLDRRIGIQDILLYCKDNDIPYPSSIIDSGRGYHLKWVYGNAIPKDAHGRWNLTQRELCDLFKPLGADRNAIDSSRILRLPGSTNSKNDMPCVVVWVNEVLGEPVRYDFDMLADDLLPYTREESRAYYKKRKKRKKQLRLIKGGKPAGEKTTCWYSWSRALRRYMDCERLIDLRGGFIAEGMRQTFFWVMLNFMIWSNQVTPETIDDNAKEIAKLINPNFLKGADWVESTYSTLTRRAGEAYGEDKGPYKFKTRTLVELLDITSREMQARNRDGEYVLKTLIDETEKYRRRKERRQKESAMKQGKRAKLITNIGREREMSGMSFGRIAKRRGLPKSTVYDYWLEYLDQQQNQPSEKVPPVMPLVKPFKE